MKTISGAVEGDQLRTSRDGETGGGEAVGGNVEKEGETMKRAKQKG